jgi:mono/diheme cytochrome c family protein
MRIVQILTGLVMAVLMPLAVLVESPRRGEPLDRVPVLDTAAEQNGQIVFMRNCDQCHPQGDGGLGPALNNKPAPPALIKFQVRRGLGAMPAFSEEDITDAELDDLVAYVVALRRAL